MCVSKKTLCGKSGHICLFSSSNMDKKCSKRHDMREQRKNKSWSDQNRGSQLYSFGPLSTSLFVWAGVLVIVIGVESRLSRGERRAHPGWALLKRKGVCLLCQTNTDLGVPLGRVISCRDYAHLPFTK